MSSQKQLEGTRHTRKGDPHSQVTPPISEMVAGGRQSAHRSTITPTRTCPANLYRRLKRRVGRSLKRAHCKGRLVPSRKQTTHKLSGANGGLSGPKRVLGPLLIQHCPHSNRQHNSSCLHKQGGRDEIGPLMCPPVENPDLVFQKTGYYQSSTHPQPAECDSRHIIQAGPNHSNRVVPQSRGLQSKMLPVAPAQSGPVCLQIQQQASTICLNSSTPPRMGSGCTHGRIWTHMPSHQQPSRQSGGEVAGLPVQ